MDIKVFLYLYRLFSCHLTDTKKIKTNPKPLSVSTLPGHRMAGARAEQPEGEEPCCFLPQAAHDRATSPIQMPNWNRDYKSPGQAVPGLARKAELLLIPNKFKARQS